MESENLMCLKVIHHRQNSIVTTNKFNLREFQNIPICYLPVFIDLLVEHYFFKHSVDHFKHKNVMLLGESHKFN
jgi:hypothetical protein